MSEIWTFGFRRFLFLFGCGMVRISNNVRKPNHFVRISDVQFDPIIRPKWNKMFGFQTLCLKSELNGLIFRHCLKSDQFSLVFRRSFDGPNWTKLFGFQTIWTKPNENRPKTKPFQPECMKARHANNRTKFSLVSQTERSVFGRSLYLTYG